MTTNEKILKHYRLIYLIMNELHCEDWDEYFFYGLMGLYKGISTYDSAKGIKETTYYTRCIKNEILIRFNYESCQRRNHRKNEISMNTPLCDDVTIEDTLVSNIDIEETIIQKEQLDLIYKALNKARNSRYKQYLYEFYGINQPRKKLKEIALKHGVTVHNVSMSIKLGIERIRKKVLEEYYGNNKKNKIKNRNKMEK